MQRGRARHGRTRTAVEALDPSTMVELTGNDALAAIAADARTRLAAALQKLAAARA
ncbi:MAG: hypothetical protein WCG47_04490 [Dermatophilaceae bacterium]